MPVGSLPADIKCTCSILCLNMSNRRGQHPPASPNVRWRPQKSVMLATCPMPTRRWRAFDAVLLLGPLYHLVEREDRVACLHEARRVLRPGGVVWGAGISHFASLFDSLAHGFFDDSAFAPILARDLKEGQHRNPTGNPIYFTDAFFHRPEELADELLTAGFQNVELVAIEGPGWLAPDFERLWNDPAQRERLLSAVRQVEHEPSALGASSHFMAIARK